MGNSQDRFIENLSLMLSSGMDVLDSLGTLSRQIRDKKLKKKVQKMHAELLQGAQLWEVLRDSDLFPNYTISLIRIGEKTGMLARNLQIIAEQREKQRQFKSKIRSAMVYPVFVFTVTLLAGLGVTWFVLPRLSRIFSELDMELPTVTQWLIASGNFISEYGWWVVPLVFFCIALIIYIVFFFKKTKFMGQWILFHIPGFHGIIVHVEVARFGYLLGTLLSVGIPVVEAIDSLERATNFYSYKKFYHYLKYSIDQGYSFEESFRFYEDADKIISYTVQNMVSTAERSGSLADTLKVISASYEEKIDSLTKNLGVILEPVMLVIVWLVVVSIAMAVILPIYSLVGGFNQGL